MKLPSEVIKKLEFLASEYPGEAAYCSLRLAEWLLEQVCNKCGLPGNEAVGGACQLPIQWITRAEYLSRKDEQ